MEQSIASARLRSTHAPAGPVDWRSIAAGFWSSIAHAGRKLASSVRRYGSRRAWMAGSLDIDTISAHLDVEERAQLDGSREQPPSTVEVITGTQGEIVAYFKDLQRRAAQRAAALAHKVRAQWETIELAETAARLRDLPLHCEDQVLRLNAKFQSRLVLLDERAAQQRQHYAAFREGNDLRRVAEYPASPLPHYAVAAAFVAAGATVLHDPSAWGLAGGTLLPVSWSVPISSLAVLLPLAIAATVFRSIDHVVRGKRSTGWAAAAAVAAVVGALAFLAGTYPVGAANSVSDLVTVIRSIVSDPGAIDLSAMAWSASAVVVLMGLVGFLAGYASDDAYPGYGAVQRAYYRARDAHDAHIKRLRKRINAVVDEASAEARSLPRRLKAQAKKYSRLAEESRRLPGGSSDYGVALEQTCNDLLDRYRAVNASARQTASPRSFAEHVRFRPETAPASSEPIDDQARLAELDRGVVEIEREAAQVRERLRNLSRAAIAASTSSAASTTG